MLAVVLAAGRGTRLGRLTERRSKAMMPVAGKPMVERVLEMLAAGGVDHAVVVAHPDDDELLDFLHASQWSLRIRLAYQEKRLGMAHALAQAAPLVREAHIETFVLASCDNLYPPGHVADLIALREARGLDGALTLMWAPCEEATASAVVRLEDSLVTDIIEKPRPGDIPAYDGSRRALTAPSLYVLSSTVLDLLHRVRRSPRGEFEFPSVIGLWIAKGARLGGCEVERRWTLTRPTDLLELNLRFLHLDPSCCTVDVLLPETVIVGTSVRIEAGARVGAGSTVGPQVYLEDRACVGPCAVVRRSVVLRGGCVDAGQTVEGSVVGRGGIHRCALETKEVPG